MKIRPHNPEDVSSILRLAKEALPGRMDRGDLSVDASMQCLVAEQDDILVGFIVYTISRPQAEILHIAVEKTMRKKGYGKALMEHVLWQCRRQGLEMVTLETKKDDRYLAEFYERFGFAAVATRKNYYQTGKDAVLMVKRLERSITDESVGDRDKLR